MAAPNTERVAAFRALHARGELLVLPNAWDAGSAALIESCGARAIATTSAAVAWSHGHADGENLPRAALCQTVAEILRVVSVPLSVDLEKGFSRSPDEVASLVLELIELGAVGINLEDGTESPELHAAKIAAVKSAAKRVGCDVFVNARTDVVLKQLVPANDAVAEVLARAERYARAGADGLFVPLLAEPDAIRKIAGAVDLPLNVMAIPSLAPVPELRALGVRRLSAGSGVAQVAFAAAQAAVERFLLDGESARLLATPTKLKGMNALLKRG
jgi:2-methylisocitrate lyase-like PEP mutase family enzyme